MIPSSFDESNRVLHVPSSWKDCEALSVYVGDLEDNPVSDLDKRPIIISCWKLTKQELEEVSRTGRIWVMIHGTKMPPTTLMGRYPFVVKDDDIKDE